MTRDAELFLAALVVLAAWCGSLYAWPFGPCPRCRGTGVNRGSNKRRFGTCRRCGGTRRVQRRGSRTVHRIAWTVRGELLRELERRRDRRAADRSAHPRNLADRDKNRLGDNAMPHPCPHHCPKPGGGGAAVVVVLGGLIIIAAIARPVVHAVSIVLEVAVVAAASVLGLAGIGGIAFLVLHQRRQGSNLHGKSQHAPIAQPGAQTLSAPQRLAIEAPRPSLADLKALAAEHGYDVIRRED